MNSCHDDSNIGGAPLGQSGAVAPPKFFIRIDAISSFFSRADIDIGYLFVLFSVFMKFKKVCTLQDCFLTNDEGICVDKQKY